MQGADAGQEGADACQEPVACLYDRPSFLEWHAELEVLTLHGVAMPTRGFAFATFSGGTCSFGMMTIK